jgi:phage host-nuclease inhibitor protein Gam
MNDNGLRDKANNLLAQIRDISGGIGMLEGEFNDQFEKLKAKYTAEIKSLKEILHEDEKQLVGLMKGGKSKLFDGVSIVKLSNGVLIYDKSDKVSIPRNAVEKLEECGFKDAVKIEKSVDRAIVEKWPDAKLLLIGAVRKPVETYSYEVKK